MSVHSRPWTTLRIPVGVSRRRPYSPIRPQVFQGWEAFSHMLFPFGREAAANSKSTHCTATTETVARSFYR